MQNVFAIIALALVAGPAMAHQGAHLHPHGIELGWASLAGGLLAAAVIAGGVRLLLKVRR